ncbi:MAG: GspH/FimT family pseudopilin [Desulfobacter sp.]|nr:MAG: GspH/FimT family pseudopilin [Desulfobacter sp.]
MIELVIVLSMIAVLSAIALPNMGGMIKEYQLRSAARGLVAAIQNIKLMAVKENKEIRIAIRQTGGKSQYITFLDANNNADYDVGEELKTIELKTYLTLTSNYADNEFGFNGRGLPSDGLGNGTITLTLAGGNSKKVVINTAGNIRVE